MPIAETNAFVLGTQAFKEQDKLVTLLTESHGLMKAVAPGSAKTKNRFGALLELFTEIHIIYHWKELKQWVTLSKANLIKSNFDLVSDQRQIFNFCLISEVLQHLITENQTNPRTFRLVKAVLEAAKETPPDLLLNYFLIWILKIEGLMFNPNICYSCFDKGVDEAFLRTDYRGILCKNCRKGEPIRLSPEDLDFIRQVLARSPKAVTSPSPGHPLKPLRELLLTKIEIHGDFMLNSKRYLT